MSGLKQNTKKIADSIAETRLKEIAELGWNDAHERIPNITEPKEIWLQPWCSDCEAEYLDGDENRFWSEANHGDCEVCGAKPSHYVLTKEDNK